MSFFKDMFSNIKLNVSNILDEVITTDEERGELANKKAQIKKRLMEALNNAEGEAEERKKQLIKTEMEGNILQKSWRPVLMLGFGFILIYHHFFAQAFSLPTTELPSEFWQLLKLGIGGYIIGRSGEKIAGSGALEKLFNKKSKE